MRKVWCNRVKFWASSLLLLLIMGCGTTRAPDQLYLRVSGPTTSVDMESSGDSDLVVGVRDFEAVQALDRTAVMLASGRVLTPSSYWYWEGTPANMVVRGVVAGINAQAGMRAVWPQTSRMRYGVMLTGHVEGFEVRRQKMEMAIALKVDAWDGRGRNWLSGTQFSAVEPLRSLDPDIVARAASRALEKVSKAVGEWLQLVAMQQIERG